MIATLSLTHQATDSIFMERPLGTMTVVRNAEPVYSIRDGVNAVLNNQNRMVFDEMILPEVLVVDGKKVKLSIAQRLTRVIELRLTIVGIKGVAGGVKSFTVLHAKEQLKKCKNVQDYQNAVGKRIMAEIAKIEKRKGQEVKKDFHF